MNGMRDDGTTLVQPAAHTPTGRAQLRHEIEVDGTVQGVGFRPFVYRLATELGIDGFVRNTGGKVVIDAAGSRASLDELLRRLSVDAPPLARVTKVTQRALHPAPAATGGFRIETSSYGCSEAVADLPPDIATCDDCLRELFDVTDRRHRYAFVNCTNCGPRATIIDGLPYDRAQTVMREFALCPDCAREYADPTNRRFHAEPVACPRCGPQLAWQSVDDSLGGRATTRCARQSRSSLQAGSSR